MTDTPKMPSVSISGGGSLNGIVGAGSGLAIAAYVLAVTYQGNLDALGAMLMKEETYLEFVIAIVVVWALSKYAPISPITDLLIFGAFAALALRIAGKVSLPSILSQFANGQATMLQTVQTIAKAL
jgi:hypothetical protein